MCALLANRWPISNLFNPAEAVSPTRHSFLCQARGDNGSEMAATDGMLEWHSRFVVVVPLICSRLQLTAQTPVMAP